MKDLTDRDTSLSDTDAIRYAYTLLSYRDRSEKELEERLTKKGFSEETAHRAISHLKEKGFINDAALALSLIRFAEETKLLGRHGVKQFLRHKGLSEKIINDALFDSDHDEIIRAKRLVEKKVRTMGDYSDEERGRKIWRFLVRKGYSFDTIRQILKDFKINEEE